MNNLVMTRGEFAGKSVTVTTASDAHADQPRRVVALGVISRQGGALTMTAELAATGVTKAGR
jgi:hypothetical protein